MNELFFIRFAPEIDVNVNTYEKLGNQLYKKHANNQNVLYLV